MAEVERIPQHRHCVKCGKAFTGVGNFCGDGCRDSTGRETKKKLYAYIAIMIVLVGITIGLTIWGK